MCYQWKLFRTVFTLIAISLILGNPFTSIPNADASPNPNKIALIPPFPGTEGVSAGNLVLSRDGTHLYTYDGYSKILVIYDAIHLRVKSKLQLDKRGNYFALAPVRHRLAVFGGGYLQIYDTEKHRLLLEERMVDDNSGVRFINDGRMIVINRPWLLTYSADLKLVSKRRLPQKDFRGFSVSPDGAFLALGWIGSLTLYKMDTLNKFWNIHWTPTVSDDKELGTVQTIVWYSERVFAACDDRGSPKIIQIANRSIKPLNSANDISMDWGQFSNDGHKLLICGGGGMNLIDVKSGKTISKVTRGKAFDYTAVDSGFVWDNHKNIVYGVDGNGCIHVIRLPMH